MPKRTLTPRHIAGINSHINFGSKLTVEYSVHCITHHQSPPRGGDNFVTFYGYFQSYFFDYQTRQNILFSIFAISLSAMYFALMYSRHVFDVHGQFFINNFLAILGRKHHGLWCLSIRVMIFSFFQLSKGGHKIYLGDVGFQRWLSKFISERGDLFLIHSEEKRKETTHHIINFHSSIRIFFGVDRLGARNGCFGVGGVAGLRGRGSCVCQAVCIFCVPRPPQAGGDLQEMTGRNIGICQVCRLVCRIRKVGIILRLYRAELAMLGFAKPCASAPARKQSAILRFVRA